MYGFSKKCFDKFADLGASVGKKYHLCSWMHTFGCWNGKGNSSTGAAGGLKEKERNCLEGIGTSHDPWQWKLQRMLAVCAILQVDRSQLGFAIQLCRAVCPQLGGKA